MAIPKRYLFVDGGHLRHNYDQQMGAFFGDVPPIDYGRLREDAQAEKLFYYDSVDRQADAAAVEAADAELNRIDGTPYCHVRQGSVRASESKRKREQKEVDVLLAVDMVSFGFRETFTEAVLLSGDVDFKPVVETLVGFGSRVEVWYASERGAGALLNAADDRHELTLIDYFGWSDRPFWEAKVGIFPRHSLEDRPTRFAHPPVRTGTVDGKAFELHRVEDRLSFVLTVEKFQGPKCLKIRGFEEASVLRFAEMVYGEVKVR